MLEVETANGNPNIPISIATEKQYQQLGKVQGPTS